MINGVYCHESGCPNTHKVKQDGDWVTVYTCGDCGTKHTDEDEYRACCHPCEDEEESE